jgi:hypothetical protein
MGSAPRELWKPKGGADFQGVKQDLQDSEFRSKSLIIGRCPDSQPSIGWYDFARILLDNRSIHVSCQPSSGSTERTANIRFTRRLQRD